MERAVQQLYQLQPQYDRKGIPVSLEQRSCKTDATSCLRRTSVVIVNIALKDYVTDENDTLRSPPDIKRMVSVKNLPELIY